MAYKTNNGDNYSIMYYAYYMITKYTSYRSFVDFFSHHHHRHLIHIAKHCVYYTKIFFFLNQMQNNQAHAFYIVYYKNELSQH